MNRAVEATHRAQHLIAKIMRRGSRMYMQVGGSITCATKFLSIAYALLASTMAIAQTKYFVSVSPYQGGLAGTTISSAGYDSLEAAEQAAVQYVNAFTPTPCVDPSCNSAPVPTSGRTIKFHTVRQNSVGALEYEYQSDWFGFQFLNQSGINCVGQVVRDALPEVLQFVPAQCQSAQSSLAIVSIGVSGAPSYESFYQNWTVTGQYTVPAGTYTFNDVIRARRVRIYITPAETPKCNQCPCDVAGASGITGSGNPIANATGIKSDLDVSFQLGGMGAFNVHYNARNPKGEGALAYGRTRMSYGRHLSLDEHSPGYAVSAFAHRDDGSIIGFKFANGQWVPQTDVNARLIELKDTGGVRTGWKYYEAATENSEQYNATGRLLSITNRAGVVQTLNYETSPSTDQAPKLLSVVNSYGRSLTFAYYPSTVSVGADNISRVTDHLGNSVAYAYDASNNLTTVTYPDGRTKTYHYNESAYTTGANLPNALTGITDENGVRFATYRYDSQGRAISTEHAGGVEKYQLNYVSPYAQTIVTDPLGTIRTYNFQTIQGVVKTTGVSQPCPSCGGNQSQATTYDANGNVSSRKDFNGIETVYVYDLARNLETSRTEGISSAQISGGSCPSGGSYYASSYGSSCGYGTCWVQGGSFPGSQDATSLGYAGWQYACAAPAGPPLDRTITTQWHPTYRLPTKITEPAAPATVGGTPGTKVTDFTYDANGNLLTRSITAPRNDGSGTNEIRTWTYTYNTLGQVLTAKDPLNRTTTTVYYAATDTAVPPKWTMGDVQTITNPAGHVTTFNEYDRNGRVTKMTDANGLVTSMTYHPRGWLSSRTVSNGMTNETTFYTYDKTGQLTRVTMPDGSNLYYAYDAAHRLVGMSDQLTGAVPETTSVTLNPPGGAPYSVTVQSLIVGLSNLAGNRIVYTLDNMGNRIKEEHFDPSNALAKRKQRAIDALNRLKQDVGGTAYASAAPAGAPVISAAIANPPANAAVSEYGYDNNGNLTSTLDPLGRLTQNQYDALNRLVQVIDPYNGSAKPTIYQYDQANNLVQVTDPQGLATKYTYNGHNNLIEQASPDTGSTKFKYNAMGNVVAKIDSMNRCTTTAYDTLHRPTSIKFYAATNTATNTQALCFGTIAGTVAVEETHTYTYDSITASLGGPGGKGRLSRVADASGRVDYVYDLNGRITSKTNVLTGATNPNRVVTYQYSANGQLRSMTYPSGQTIAYIYGSPGSANPGKITGLMLNPTSYTATAEGGNVPTGGVSIIANSDYKPFGPNEGWNWGNHNLNAIPNQHLRDFDLDYRPSFIGNDPEGYTRNIIWDRANRITGITVPSAMIIPGLSNSQSVNQAFGYDQLDRLTSFTPGVSGATSLSTGMALLPNEQFTYDAIGNRLSRTTTAPGTSTNQIANYSYPNTTATPAANRRHILNGISGAQVNAYTYDASGNTLTESAALATMNPATGQLNPTNATQALAYTYDAKNRLARAQIGANTADFVTYKINALGQRVQKTGAGLYAYSTTATIDAATGNSPLARSLNFNARYVYDESGRLLGEYAPDGKLISETVYFNDLPIATLRPKGANAGTPLGLSGTTTGNPSNGATAANANNVGNNSTTNRVNVEIFYVHPDHLGTPRVVTRSTVATGANAPSSATPTSPGAINKAVWRHDSDPFGTSLSNSAPVENPQLLAGTATVVQAGSLRQNFRMSWQTFDGETGKHQNRYREYDPIGRYTQSDPIGLDAGLNTFAFVDNQPLNSIDPFGLQSTVIIFDPSYPYDQTNGMVDKANRADPCMCNQMLGHGGPDGMWDSKRKRYLTPGEVCSMIRSAPNFNPELPIRLGGCNVGKRDFCQRVANVCGVAVSCPDNYVWYGGDQLLINGKKRGHPLETAPRDPDNPGDWRTFPPRIRR